MCGLEAPGAESSESLRDSAQSQPRSEHYDRLWAGGVTHPVSPRLVRPRCGLQKDFSFTSAAAVIGILCFDTTRKITFLMGLR